MARRVVSEGQCIDFPAQPLLWSAEGAGWLSFFERL
jgi:hypothetical protein